MIDMTLREFGAKKNTGRGGPLDRSSTGASHGAPGDSQNERGGMDGTGAAEDLEYDEGAVLREARESGIRSGPDGQGPDQQGIVQRGLAQRDEVHQGPDRQEVLRRAVVWSEILGGPVCKRRKRSRHGC